jgi:hypothetical protein
LSLSILIGLSFSPPTPFATISCYPFTSPSFSFSISSTLTLPMAKSKIYNMPIKEMPPTEGRPDQER